MNNIEDSVLHDSSWVYVRENSHDDYTIGLAFDNDFPLREAAAGRRIILWRRFEDMLAASGYRLVLGRLNTRELRRVVRLYNHRQKLKQHLTELNNNPK